MEINKQKCQRNAMKFDKYFMKQMDEGVTSCFSIEVSKNNEIIYEFTNGNSSPDKKSGTPVTKETLFNVGSVTKTITAALFVRFIEMGLILMNDPVKKFIQEYRFGDVEIYHLLTHTTGFEGKMCETIEPPETNDSMHDFYRKIYNIDYRKNLPGETWDYFTLGYCILKDIMERVSGVTYNNLVKEYIFNPIGMNHSYFDQEELKEREYIQPWDYKTAMFRPDLAPHPVIGDRGLFTTASDLVKFGNLFLKYEFAEESALFKKPSIDFMLRDVTKNKFNQTPVFWIKTEQDTHGCFGDLNSPSAVGHTGYSGCMLFIDPVYQTCASILTNSIKLHEDWKYYKKYCNVIMSM